MENKYYLYRHIRLDTNEVFYVGTGTKKNKKFFRTITSEYQRAYCYKAHSRNSFWNKIFNKTQIKTEIIWETDSNEEIEAKEIEFIKLYGRRNLGLGTLVNLTDGGRSTKGVKVSEHTKKKQRDNSYLKRLKGSPDHPARSVEVYVYNKEGLFVEKIGGIENICKKYKIPQSGLWQQDTGLVTNNKGWRMYRKYQGLTIEPLLFTGYQLNEKYILQLDDNKNIINKFRGAKEAAKTVGCVPTSIYCAIYRKGKAKKFYWEYLC